VQVFVHHEEHEEIIKLFFVPFVIFVVKSLFGSPHLFHEDGIFKKEKQVRGQANSPRPAQDCSMF